MTENIGIKRVESQIRLIITEALSRHLSDPRLDKIASITKVEVSGDFAFADVYFSVMGGEDEQQEFMDGIERARGVLQKMVAKKLRTRTCPRLRFYPDQSIKQSFETMQAIDRAMERTNPAKDQTGDEDDSFETPDESVIFEEFDDKESQGEGNQ